MRVWRAGEGISQTFQTITSELFKTQIMIIRNYTRGPEASLFRHNNSFLKCGQKICTTISRRFDVWFLIQSFSMFSAMRCARLIVEVCNKCMEVLMASVSKWWDGGNALLVSVRKLQLSVYAGRTAPGSLASQSACGATAVRTWAVLLRAKISGHNGRKYLLQSAAQVNHTDTGPGCVWCDAPDEVEFMTIGRWEPVHFLILSVKIQS